MSVWFKLSACFITLLGLGGCASTTSLYDDLGGKQGIETISANFIANIGDDPDIRPFFENTNLDRFYEMFTLHLCVEVDGPCTYTGDDMHSTHVGMNISEANFNQTVDLLIDAMDKAGIEHRIQNRVLARLAPLRKDIIYR